MSGRDPARTLSIANLAWTFNHYLLSTLQEMSTLLVAGSKSITGYRVDEYLIDNKYPILNPAVVFESAGRLNSFCLIPDKVRNVISHIHLVQSRPHPSWKRQLTETKPNGSTRGEYHQERGRVRVDSRLIVMVTMSH